MALPQGYLYGASPQGSAHDPMKHILDPTGRPLCPAHATVYLLDPDVQYRICTRCLNTVNNLTRGPSNV